MNRRQTEAAAVANSGDDSPEDEGYLEFLHFLQSPTLGIDDNKKCHLDLERELRDTSDNKSKPDPTPTLSLNLRTPRKKDPNDEKKVAHRSRGSYETLEVRDESKATFEGKDRFPFSSADVEQEFHEDEPCQEFDAATAINGGSMLMEEEHTTEKDMVSVDSARFKFGANNSLAQRLKRLLTYRIPVVICRAFVARFLKRAITKGELQLKLNDGTLLSFGDKTPCEGDVHPVTARVFDDWFFVMVATEHDLGLARSYLAGHFLVEPLASKEDYPLRLRSHAASTKDETKGVIGDPVGLIRLFLLFFGNINNGTIGFRCHEHGRHISALQHASGLVVSNIGLYINFLRSKLFMINSEKSLKNIHSHYDISNDFFRMFLDKDTLVDTSAISNATTSNALEIGRPSSLVFKGILEDAHRKKLGMLCDRAQLKQGQTVLDIGFGWAGLSVHAAKNYGCHVTCITLSADKKALAEERVKNEGVDHLISFEVIDYHTFARRLCNRGRFDRVICGKTEAVSQERLGEFLWAVEQLMRCDGLLVMEAITSSELSYENYLPSTDIISTVVSPPRITPSIHSLMDELYRRSSLNLEHIDNIGLYHAETLAEWRYRFNANEKSIRKMGYDDVFMRLWNYYMTYYESGFRSQTEYCLILVLSCPDDSALAPWRGNKSVTQLKSLTTTEVDAWLD
ncbi:hypothetical protein HJC23_011376 [Cyclotella cryptica]|uniref:Cyclopropane-fatty-acyl-phospholipid synthase n=1 Tax=Cyclotella cryptica TaxID=29204 RepID=A0ABD3PUX2_9STRA